MSMAMHDNDPFDTDARRADDARVDDIVAHGPRGAWAVAGIATAIVVAIYVALYVFAYLPRGAVQ